MKEDQIKRLSYESYEEARNDGAKFFTSSGREMIDGWEFFTIEPAFARRGEEKFDVLCGGPSLRLYQIPKDEWAERVGACNDNLPHSTFGDPALLESLEKV